MDGNRDRLVSALPAFGFRYPDNPRWFENALIPSTMLFLMLVYFIASSAHAADATGLVSKLQDASRYPASFGNLWYSFALALFSTMTMTSVSLGMILDNLRSIREYRLRWTDQAHVYMRIQIAGFAVFVTAGSGDAVSLLLWGDVSGRTMEIVLAADRYLDFFSIIPFLYYVLLRARAQPVMIYNLQAYPPVDTRPTFKMIRRHVAMVGTCLFAALMVALSK